MKWNYDNLKKLQQLGYEYIAAVRKSYYSSTYYNIQNIQDIIDNDCHWISAFSAVEGRHINWSITCRRAEIDMILNEGIDGKWRAETLRRLLRNGIRWIAMPVFYNDGMYNVYSIRRIMISKGKLPIAPNDSEVLLYNAWDIDWRCTYTPGIFGC